MLDICTSKRFHTFETLQFHIEHIHNPAALLDTSELIEWIKAKGRWVFKTAVVESGGVRMIFQHGRNLIAVVNRRGVFWASLYDKVRMETRPTYRLAFRSEAYAPAAIELYTADLRLKNYTLDISTRDAVRRLVG